MEVDQSWCCYHGGSVLSFMIQFRLPIEFSFFILSTPRSSLLFLVYRIFRNILCVLENPWCFFPCYEGHVIFVLHSFSVVISMLDQSYIPGMPPIWSWCLVVFCVAGFGVLLFSRISTSAFLQDTCADCVLSLTLVVKTLTSENGLVKHALQLGLLGVTSVLDIPMCLGFSS